MASVVNGTVPTTPGLIPLLILYLCVLVFYCAVAAYLLYHRKWPPIQARMVSLTTLPAIGAVVWFTGWAMWMEVLENVGCMSIPLGGIGVSITLSTQLIRKYRYYNIFVRHTNNQWHPLAQASVAILLSNMATIADMATARYDADQGRCNFGPGFITYLYLPCHFAVLALSLWYNYQLRKVRQQFNEHRSSTTALVMMIVVLLLFPFFELSLEGIYTTGERDRALGVPLLLFYTILGSGLAFLHTALPLAYRRWIDDQLFLQSFTFGMNNLPDPALLSGELQEQLYEPVVLDELKRFAGARLSGELVEFYEVVLQRESTVDYFERQAISMKIIEEFIQFGAPKEINIPSDMRRRILVTDINRLDAFDDAKREVMKLIKTNLGADFLRSPELSNLRRKLEAQSLELQLLQQAGLTPELPPNAERTASTSRSGSGDSPYVVTPSAARISNS